MTAPMAVYGAALRRAARGDDAAMDLVDPDGTVVRPLDAGAWSGRLRPGDHRLIDRCADGTLDLGCGPGRLIEAIAATGRRALGVDISPQAVRYARRRGAPAIRGNLFGPLPGEGGWACAVLADGNIGIGGDPARLLARCHALIATAGSVLVEVDPPGSRTWSGHVALTGADRTSSTFAWAFVSADDITAVARDAALRLAGTWTEAGRWFAHLTP
ncbi:class I SAM-dependent methyltransferase [Dactylosporangium siamense]|uniref:Methyltransferase type 12 n=1 Tax=Dactylosporangium siamense TaxID=685454 RepID=A0A919PUH8_9ACTN|nr:class I SAM-dependent methyltransferase [Dactylosporangium siamense]GIG48648.1 methyltransferase type 12 [Dactylosporangium siamense]